MVAQKTFGCGILRPSGYGIHKSCNSFTALDVEQSGQWRGEVHFPLESSVDNLYVAQPPPHQTMDIITRRRPISSRWQPGGQKQDWEASSHGLFPQLSPVGKYWTTQCLPSFCPSSLFVRVRVCWGRKAILFSHHIHVGVDDNRARLHMIWRVRGGTGSDRTTKGK
jgi:hypothetical protein